jgi:hypothetical protein
MKTATRPLFTCVTENTPEWFHKVHNLVLSLREFGGSLREAPIVVHFVEAVESDYERTLRDLGADVKVVAPYGSRYRFSNKMRMFDLFQSEYDFDVLFTLDCDVIVSGDVAPLLPAESVGVVPAGRDLFTAKQWLWVYKEFDLSPPAPNCIMRVSGQRTYPYYNTGVMTIPRSVGPDLVATWSDFLARFQPVHERFGRVHHENQIAFALAVRANGVQVNELPVSLNFSTVVSVDRRFRHELRGPFVIHYHQAIDGEGFIKSSTNSKVNRATDEFNRRRAEVLGMSYARLPRPPMRARLQKAVATQGWYNAETVKRVRRSSLGSAIKRISTSGTRRA